MIKKQIFFYVKIQYLNKKYNANKTLISMLNTSWNFSHLKLVGNKSTTTQNITASAVLVRASKRHDRARVSKVLCTQFRPRTDAPDATKLQTIKTLLKS